MPPTKFPFPTSSLGSRFNDCRLRRYQGKLPFLQRFTKVPFFFQSKKTFQLIRQSNSAHFHKTDDLFVFLIVGSKLMPQSIKILLYPSFIKNIKSFAYLFVKAISNMEPVLSFSLLCCINIMKLVSGGTSLIMVLILKQIQVNFFFLNKLKV